MPRPRFLMRIRFITLVLLLVAVLCIGRLWYLQIYEGSAYAARATNEFTIPASSLLSRDTIYFTTSDGTEVAAATTLQGTALAINPQALIDPAKTYAQLNTLVPLPESDFLAKAKETQEQYVVLTDHLSTTTGAAIEALALPGVIVANDNWRYYPGGSLAAQTIGFVGYGTSTELTGQYGLEQEYNTLLSRSASDLYVNFFVQLFAGVQSVLQGQETGSIVTTIDPSVQAELEREIASYVSAYHPQVAGGIIMNPQNGEIYAMGSYPTFDLNTYGAQTDPAVYKNPLVENIYEMGSIIKPLTMAAGIDSGAVTPETTYNDTACITVDKAHICNWDFKGHGIIPMQQVISQSLNVGASFIATQMGQATMRDYFVHHFGLGSTTGIDLPGEVHGIVNNLYAPEQVDYDTASFGQGIALTPMEVIRAEASIANGGYLVVPHAVRAIQYDDGLTSTLNWNQYKVQVLKPETAAEVSQMLTTFTDVALYNGKYKFDHYYVGTKTGTAQVPDPQTGGYTPNTYLHSYISFLPSINGQAQYIVFLFAYEPVGATYSDQTWTLYWHDLIQFLINYYNVPPDR